MISQRSIQGGNLCGALTWGLISLGWIVGNIYMIVEYDVEAPGIKKNGLEAWLIIDAVSSFVFLSCMVWNGMIMYIVDSSIHGTLYKYNSEMTNAMPNLQCIICWGLSGLSYTANIAIILVYFATIICKGDNYHHPEVFIIYIMVKTWYKIGLWIFIIIAI